MYSEVICKQGTDEWHLARNQLLLTGSNMGTVLSNNPYKSRNEFLIDTFLCKKTILNKAMLHGQEHESIAREWYHQKYGREVRESGILIPDWNPEIGGSLDGFVEDETGPGIIEIKCPQKMYDFTLTEKNPMGMPMYHFDQIQFYLRVTERNWCDYVVWTEKEIKVKRILRNNAYWEKIMYPLIKEFLIDLKKLKNQEVMIEDFPYTQKKFYQKKEASISDFL